MKRQFWLRLFVIIVSFLVLELTLRLIGFGEYPIYYESGKYEYAFKHNQSLKRFGNVFYINELGMRSDEVGPSDKLVMGFGDSVLNGGVAVSQNDLASSKIDSALRVEDHVLKFTNTSAGSWGVSNAYNWLINSKLKKPEAIVLVFSSHDWNDKMQFQKVVGNISFYPDSQPLLAITDAMSWFYSRYVESIKWSELPVWKDYQDAAYDYDSGWTKFADYAKSNNIPLIVYHHANKEEVITNAWNEKGIMLETLLTKLDIQHISGLDNNFTEIDFRDEIHPSISGQQKIANAIIPVIKSNLKHE